MRGEARVEAAASYPIVLRSHELLPTSMSDYDASSRYSACRRLNAPLDRTSGASRSGSTIGWAEPFLGMGSGDRFEVSQGDSGLLEGGVRLADETA